MAPTARDYGLRVSKRVDERVNPDRATQAAVGYLHTLRERFGSDAPLHVLAAYNFGENNLSKALRRARTNDIWPLFVHRRLPYQTREYLIKMVTLWVIVAHPDRFSLTLHEAALPPAQSIEVAQRAGSPGE